MKKSLLFILGIVLITITSCEYNIVEPIVVELSDEPASFATDIEPIFQDKCVSCHTSRSPIVVTGSAYDNLIDGGYINTDDPASSEIYVKVNSGHHSSNPLSPEESAWLLKWITEGAENN
ncbi:MAG: hypothetical protein PF485_12640 [Bacteroidales bacterium]|jgi:hypothetical protein|nr:hypothetical protein [Bacteroidales bacterium]